MYVVVFEPNGRILTPINGDNNNEIFNESYHILLELNQLKIEKSKSNIYREIFNEINSKTFEGFYGDRKTELYALI